MPSESKQSNICEVYRLSPDGSKGEHLKTIPGFPEGWDDKLYGGAFKHKEEESEMTRTARTRKPSSEEMEQNWEKCGKTINAFANQYDIGWATARTWLTEAGLLEPKTTAEPEPKKDYFGTPIVEEEPKEPEAGCPFDEPIFNPDQPTDGFTPADEEPIPYRPVESKTINVNIAVDAAKAFASIKEMNEAVNKIAANHALTAELTKLKLDFANLTLASALGDVAKLKVIEYIVRM